uniref:Uncharacterized protein n=1 Tax=Rhizophora mucronata TaxID=61149 RepID=A0A2P2PJX3_RHIMU
MSCQNILLFV